MGPTVVPGGDLAKVQRAVCMLSNTTAIAELGPGSTTNSILCTPNVLSSTGMSVKVWKKVNSPKLGKISPLLRKTTKRSVSTQSKANERKKVMNSKNLKNYVTLEKFLFFMQI